MAQAIGNSQNAAGSVIANMYSQLSQAVLGHNSVYSAVGGQALTPTARDDSVFIAPANGVQTPVWVANNKIIYTLPKTATLIGKMWHEVTLSAGQTNPALGVYTPGRPADPANSVGLVLPVGTPHAEYIKNIGDLIYSYILLRYGTTVLQQYVPEMVVFKRYMEINNINIQDINVEVLGNLSPGGNGELTLVDAFYTGVTLRHPLQQIWFTQSPDRHWMPESLALEGTLEFTLRDPQNCIITTNGLASDLLTTPSISNCVLRYQQITLSAAEKMNRLALYKSPEGMVNLFEDNEDQLQFQFTPTVGTRIPFNPVVINQVVPLSNFRMDSKEIFFVVRVAQMTPNPAYVNPFGIFSGQLAKLRGSPVESDRTSTSLLTTPALGGNCIGTMVPVVAAKLVSNGKDLFNFVPELYLRTHVRKQYHPDAEVGSYIYSFPFAIFPEDCRNATGHISTATLGNLQLVLQISVNGPEFTYQVDCWSLAYNLMQSRGGSIVKALN